MLNTPVQHGLCECLDEPGYSIKAYCCPCCIAGDVSAKIGGSYMTACCLVFCCANLGTGLLRHSHLSKMNKGEGLVMDCLVGCCCPCCSLVQCRREADHFSNTSNIILVAPTQTVIHSQPLIQPGVYAQPGYPQQGVAYPPQQGAYPPQQGVAYPPQQGVAYPPQQGGYPSI